MQWDWRACTLIAGRIRRLRPKARLRPVRHLPGLNSDRRIRAADDARSE